MTTKHTPGPWTFHLDDDSTKLSAYFSAKDCNSQFITQTPETNYNSDDVDRVRANARLIAAAPDLLEALKGLLPMWESDISEPWVDNARKAIAKATGE